MRIKNKKPVLVFMLSAAIILFFALRVVINVTPSMPEGIYFKSSASFTRENIVLVCLDEVFQHLGISQRYLLRGHYICSQTRPLIKHIIAIPGDHVVLSDQAITVNGHDYLYPTFYQDARQRRLNVYPRGDYQQTSAYWLLGEAVNSWDSRYWGPVDRRAIKNRLIPLVTW